VAETVAAAVAPSDIIFSCLMDSHAVNEAFATILEGNLTGKLFVECSTISPELTDELALKIQAAGAEFVAMPVFGEPAMAEDGNLICVLAGLASSVDRVRPYLEGVIGRAIIDLSDSKPSTATLLKNIGNVFIVGMIETVAEGHVLAEKTGLSVENLQKFISAVLPGPYMIYSNRMSSGDYYMKEPPVALSMAQHLASEILEMGKKSGASLKAYQVAFEHMKLAREHFGSAGDISGIYAAVRLESGLSLRNQEQMKSTET
jgi:3-hydroxyisobutyrate dehydrogenase-like beta-hydroxyacid dehydrogenase